MSNLKVLLWFCYPLALIPLALTWPLWILAGVGRGVARLLRPEGVKVTERNRAIAAADLRRQRIQTVIQMQLAARGLLDTPENRALVVSILGRGR